MTFFWGRHKKSGDKKYVDTKKLRNKILIKTKKIFSNFFVVITKTLDKNVVENNIFLAIFLLNKRDLPYFFLLFLLCLKIFKKYDTFKATKN